MTDIPNIITQAEVFDGNTVFDDVWILNKLHYDFTKSGSISFTELNVVGVSTIGGDLVVNGSLSSSSDLNLSGDTTIGQNLTVSGALGVVGLTTVGDIRVYGSFKDSTGSTGSTGKLLQSTGTGTEWIAANATSVNNAINVGVNVDSTNANQFISFFGSSSGNQPNRVDSNLTYNPSTNTMSGINYSGTSTFNNTKVTGITTAATLEVEGQLRDGDGNFGSAGKVLTSDGTDTKWDTIGSLAAGSAAQIAISNQTTGTHRILFSTSTGSSQDVLSNSSLTYNTSTQVILGRISSIDNHDTGDLSEGSNLYHTTARARSAISASGALSYNSSTGVMSFSGGNDTLDNVCDRGATTNQAITAQGGVSDGSGDLRVIINNTKSGSYTLTSADVGELINTNSQVTVPSGVFSAGQAISIYNNSGSGITIAQGGSVTMYLAGSNTTGNRALSSRGVATVLCVASNTFTIMGAGLA
tara:strand:+ start:114 stop:1523 length:1410 start_codon:yes stop_codon:yes gene_type:complete